MGSSFTSHNGTKSRATCGCMWFLAGLEALSSLTCDLHVKTPLRLLCLFLDSHPFHPCSLHFLIFLVLTHCLLCDELHHKNFLQVAMGAFCSTFRIPGLYAQAMLSFWHYLALLLANAVFWGHSPPCPPSQLIPSVFVSYWILLSFYFFTKPLKILALNFQRSLYSSTMDASVVFSRAWVQQEK